MAAFPAYSNVKTASEDKQENQSEDWLHCSSFVPFDNKAVELSAEKRKSRRHGEKDSRRHKLDSETAEASKYLIDVKPMPQVKCTSPQKSPSTPSNLAAPNKPKKKKKKHTVKSKSRYFSEELPLEPDLNKMSSDEYLKYTKEYNVQLRESPHDVDTWCKYISLQDKGEGTRSGIMSKKLSIVDKALEHNSSSEVLLAIKLALMEELYPYDKVVTEAKILASKHSSSRVGWRWLISSMQFNLTRLTVPGLINHFGAMLEDATKRGGQPKFILDVFLEVGFFLRHAGLWELLWTLVEQYLEICFTVIGSGAFKVTVPLPQQEIDKTEDGIMTSGLPLHALWIRTEHLRSCVHFLPTTEDTGDHQRMVLPEDVAPLMYPVTADLSSRLSSIALTLLKVPPLPCTEGFVLYLGLNNIPWHLESSEILLTASLRTGVFHAEDSYLNELKELLVPPQYIKENLGCEIFMEAVNKMFDLIAEHCKQDRINFLVWQMRWWRYLMKTKSLSEPNAKPFLIKAKAILKKERSALAVYTEYALLEEAVGSVGTALKVLETAINLHEPGLYAGKRQQRCIFAAYRAYVEVLLRNEPTDYKERFFKLMIAMAHGEKLVSVKEVSSDLIQKSLERFEHISSEMLSHLEAEESSVLEDVVTGCSNISWLACHSWFSFVQRGKLPHFLTQNLQFAQSPMLSESLTQLKIDILGRMHQVGCSAFDNKEFVDLVANASSQYPNNTSILHALSSLKCHGLRWSQISTSLVLTGSQIAVMFLSLLSKNRLFTGDGKQTGSINKMYSILTMCAKYEQLERCPMLRRLILQYVSCSFDENAVEREYHKAVEKCPWVKVLFYEAANQLPKILADIQDLLTEKELRIHVTPEELEILREPAPEVTPMDGTADEAMADKYDPAKPSNSSSGNEGSSTSGSESSEDDEDCTKDARSDLRTKLKSSTEDCEAAKLSTPLKMSEGPRSEADNEEKVDISQDAVRSADLTEIGESKRQIKEQGNEVEEEVGKTTIDEVEGPDSWNAERMNIARLVWESKRKAKRKWGDSENEENSAGNTNCSSGERQDPKKNRVQNDMSKLEDVQKSRMAEDTCKDDETKAVYEDSVWNEQKLKIMRELWESKRKK